MCATRGESQKCRQRCVAWVSSRSTSSILTKIMYFAFFSIFFRLTCRGTPRSTGAMRKIEEWPGRRRGSKVAGTSCNSWLVGIGIDIYACVFRACTTDSRVPARAGHCWPRNSTGCGLGASVERTVSTLPFTMRTIQMRNTSCTSTLLPAAGLLRQARNCSIQASSGPPREGRPPLRRRFASTTPIWNAVRATSHCG